MVFYFPFLIKIVFGLKHNQAYKFLSFFLSFFLFFFLEKQMFHQLSDHDIYTFHIT